MRKLLKKIYNAVVPVSRKDFGECMTNVTIVLDGMRVSNTQQAEIITNLVNQVSGLQMVKAEKDAEKNKEIEYDEAFQ